MNAVHANIIDQNGFLFRTCEHGIRHPVGHLDRELILTGNFPDTKEHHQLGEPVPMIAAAKCCGCCDVWRDESSATGVEEQA